MSWLFSQALVAEYLGDTSLDGEQSVPLSGNLTQQAYLSHGKTTKFSRLSRFGMTVEPLTDDRGQVLLTSYLEDFRAKTSLRQEKALESQVADQECGNTWLASLAKYDHSTSMWRTAQCSLLEDSMSFSLTLPRWGSMQSGALYPLPTLVQTISVKEFGSEPNNETFFHTPNTTGLDGGSNGRKALKKRLKWPTPTASKGGAWRSDGQIAMIANIAKTYQEYLMLTKGSCKSKRDKYWPTPTANEDAYGKPSGKMQKMLGNHPEERQDPDGGTLNPTWVEWVMGWPLGWTDLKPLEMDKYQKWLEQHGGC